MVLTVAALESTSYGFGSGCYVAGSQQPAAVFLVLVGKTIARRI